jgi:hypothetical protein
MYSVICFGRLVPSSGACPRTVEGGKSRGTGPSGMCVGACACMCGAVEERVPAPITANRVGVTSSTLIPPSRWRGPTLIITYMSRRQQKTWSRSRWDSKPRPTVLANASSILIDQPSMLSNLKYFSQLQVAKTNYTHSSKSLWEIFFFI